jgi:hypothetical protein
MIETGLAVASNPMAIKVPFMIGLLGHLKHMAEWA